MWAILLDQTDLPALNQSIFYLEVTNRYCIGHHLTPLNAVLQNDNSFHFHTCKWDMKFLFHSFLAVTLVWFPNKNVYTMASLQKLGPASSHIFTISYPFLKTKMSTQEWLLHRFGLKKTEVGRSAFLDLLLFYLPGCGGCLGSETWTDRLMWVWKECLMTMSHYSHHFKAVLVAGRKWYGSLENKTPQRGCGLWKILMSYKHCISQIFIRSFLPYIRVRSASESFHMEPTAFFGFGTFVIQPIPALSGKESTKSSSRVWLGIHLQTFHPGSSLGSSSLETLNELKHFILPSMALWRPY